MTVPDQPPLPVCGVTLQFHKETRQLRATDEESAFADLLTASRNRRGNRSWTT